MPTKAFQTGAAVLMLRPSFDSQPADLRLEYYCNGKLVAVNEGKGKAYIPFMAFDSGTAPQLAPIVGGRQTSQLKISNSKPQIVMATHDLGTDTIVGQSGQQHHFKDENDIQKGTATENPDCLADNGQIAGTGSVLGSKPPEDCEDALCLKNVHDFVIVGRALSYSGWYFQNESLTLKAWPGKGKRFFSYLFLFLLL